MVKKQLGVCYEGHCVGTGLRVALVVSRFNHFITDRLLEGAQDALLRHGVKSEDIHTAWVPGAFELPLVAQTMALSGKYHAVVCLGAVIKGATPHFDMVANQTVAGIMRVGLEAKLPVVLGVLTTHTLEEAIERAGTKAGNKGAEAAVTAVEMAVLMKRLSADEQGDA
jgi:6,7-dimethyl-8-ribityllumazine synthase